ncbi:GNAT family N-acetyltransferase [Oscillatoria sp. CS-180]|uniref:GNAT family N-acetyltransferase n=1 Tax=Oscillatoria sp. CS-180 TaxID=3021720 RepID=UPI002330D64E|nr:GNAT family N-acetyltransferase [Oscillatoria sp. CS-180]MDB9529354.1 GNAT family N-acetyltransferase [Oscillatoria sp. CS-180]
MVSQFEKQNPEPKANVTDNSLPLIQIATAMHESPAVDVLLLAFSADPIARWTWPDPQQYVAHFPSFVEAVGGKAFVNGSAYYIDGYAGAALWLPPGIYPNDDELIDFLQNTVSKPLQKDIFTVFETLERYHPDEPHWYLPLLGVDPYQRNKGYGSALMHHTLAQCDRDQVSAYLESSSVKSIPFYERHGFEVLGTLQVETSPPFFPMLRRPR